MLVICISKWKDIYITMRNNAKTCRFGANKYNLNN